MLLLKGIFTNYLRCQNVLKMPTSLQSSLQSRNLIARNLICCASNKQNHIFHQKRNATENKGHRYRDERSELRTQKFIQHNTRVKNVQQCYCIKIIKYFNYVIFMYYVMEIEQRLFNR